jgi:hypothetical protein
LRSLVGRGSPMAVSLGNSVILSYGLDRWHSRYTQRRQSKEQRALRQQETMVDPARQAINVRPARSSTSPAASAKSSNARLKSQLPSKPFYRRPDAQSRRLHFIAEVFGSMPSNGL